MKKRMYPSRMLKDLTVSVSLQKYYLIIFEKKYL